MVNKTHIWGLLSFWYLIFVSSVLLLKKKKNQGSGTDTHLKPINVQDGDGGCVVVGVHLGIDPVR